MRTGAYAKAKRVMDGLLKLYLSQEIIEEQEYIKARVELDKMSLGALIFQMETAERAIITMLDSIDSGEMHPRMFEVLGGLQKTLLDIVKSQTMYLMASEENMKKLSRDIDVYKPQFKAIAAEKTKEQLPLMDTPLIKKIEENQLPSGLSSNERNQDLFQNDIHKLHCNSSSILLTIQDNNEMDYDKIAIEVNNDMILSNYTLSKQAKQLSIPLKSEHTLIKICALNEGNSAPNTAFINIQSTSFSKSFISNLSTDACTTIDIKKD
jgi:hypothetical protein